MTDRWEQTFRLVEDHGHAGAVDIVASGLVAAADKDEQALHGWMEIAECLNTMAYASRTKH